MATMSGRSPRVYDAIVVGVGGMGSAACYHLARRGLRTLGLERFDIPHTMGSSHGITRIIRLAYYEHPSYVPLLLRAFELWDELERESGRHLLEVTGTIDASGPDEIVFTGALASCEQFGLAHEVLTSAELTARYPGYQLPPDHLALFQPRGGFLLPERCISAHVEGALAAGAEIRARERVIDWEPVGDGVRVSTDRGVYEAGKTGARGRRLDGLAGPRARRVWPSRSGRCWAGSRPWQPALFAPERFPVFNLMVPEGRYYGFPQYDVPGFKIGLYHHLQERGRPGRFPARGEHGRRSAAARGHRTLLSGGERPDHGPAHLHVHQYPGRAFHPRRAAGVSPGRGRLALLRARLQVRLGHRRDPGRSRAER